MKPLSQFRAARLARVVLALTIIASAGTAYAQLRLPSINLPGASIGPIGADLLREPLSRLPAVRELPSVMDVRAGQVRRLLRQYSDVLEADPRGEPIVRQEILAWSPSPAGLAAARAAGLIVVEQRQLDGLDDTMVVLRVPAGAATALVLAQLRALDPDGSYDFNHVYTGSGGGDMASATAAGPAGAPNAPRKPGTATVGLVDSGVDAGHEVFDGASIARWGCGDTVYPDAHGTSVAALMVGQSRAFRGVSPKASLYAADIYCNSGTGGSADKIAAALAWMARERVGVINMSIVGPPNQTLERVVGAMVKRGHLLVAAVGNDGPAAAPLYPASYPGVVGVSAVDKRGRVLPEAGRGKQVMFAAPGNNMLSANVGTPAYRQVRGTSFAAPIVAAMLADKHMVPDKLGAARALDALARQAAGNGNGGPGTTVSNETGFGVVGQQFRIDPATLR